jgi:hypothetical protein
MKYIPAMGRAPMAIAIRAMIAELFVTVSFPVAGGGSVMFLVPAAMMLLHVIMAIGFAGRSVIPVIPVMGKGSTGTHQQQGCCDHHNFLDLCLHGFSPLLWLRF